MVLFDKVESVLREEGHVVGQAEAKMVQVVLLIPD